MSRDAGHVTRGAKPMHLRPEIQIGRWWAAGSESNLIEWLQRTHLVRLLLFMAIAIAVRMALYNDFPVFLTQDSGDYILASADIARHLDFYSRHLGDWRLPAYPAFLALTQPITEFKAQNIVLGQKAVGMCSILLGFTMGYLLRSRLLTEALVLFLGLNPVYLLNEHLVMTESFFLLTLLGFSVIVLICLQGIVGLFEGVILGATLGLCVLTRANGLFFCAPLIVGVILVRFVYQNTFLWLARIKRNQLGFTLGCLAAICVTLGAWAWRNYTMFGIIAPLTHNTNRNLIIYQSQHDLFDTTLPAIRRFGRFYDVRRPHTIYDLIWELGSDTIEAEKLAGGLAREQIAHRPGRYLQEVAYAFLNFAGYPLPHLPGYGRADVYGWFERIVSDVTLLNAANSSFALDPADTDFSYTPYGQDTVLTQLWSQAGLFFLQARPVLFSLFVVCCFAYLVRYRLQVTDVKDVAIFLFGFAYLTIILLHSLTLSDYDRFAAPFDWIPIVVISLVVSKLASSQNRGVLDEYLRDNHPTQIGRRLACRRRAERTGRLADPQ